MHIFLTGEREIGKSTVIKKALTLLNAGYGGFCTYFGPDRANPDRCLYICDASQPYRFEERHVIVRFRPLSAPDVYSETFDDLGTAFLRSARKKAYIVVMDECGNFEQTAKIFRKEVLRTLDSTIPVLGVVRQSASGWVDAIRNHPNVRLITVDTANRDSLPSILAADITADLHNKASKTADD